LKWIRTYKTGLSQLGLLVVCLFLALFGVWKFYELKSHRKEIGKQILEGIPIENLTHLSFDDKELAQLEWEHSKEFEYKNQMYDVVSAELINGRIHYWCWLDDKESEMHSNFQQLVAKFLGTDQQRNSEKEAIGKLLSSLFTPKNIRLNLDLISKSKKSIYFYLNTHSEAQLSSFYSPPDLTS
jgi:hypothetical protein